uniref:Uncharacterized protein n=1 Tax=Oryza glumipatula TaxID=40148 RepID=A0A0E0ASN5_9ORYZ
MDWGWRSRPHERSRRRSPCHPKLALSPPISAAMRARSSKLPTTKGGIRGVGRPLSSHDTDATAAVAASMKRATCAELQLEVAAAAEEDSPEDE